MAPPSLKRASAWEWSQPRPNSCRFCNGSRGNYATTPGSVPKRQRRELPAYSRTAKPIELPVNDRHAHPDEQGWTALSEVSATLSPRNLTNRPRELRSIDKLGGSLVSSLPLLLTTHLPTWPTDMSGDQFSQSQAECSAAATAPLTAFSYGVPESIQSDSGSLANSNAYAGVSTDSFLDDMFSVVHESDGFGPLGSFGSWGMGGWVENIDRPSQPYPQPMWNDLLSLDQSREHYTDNGFWNVPHSTNHDLPLHLTGPHHTELGPSIAPTQPDSLLETQYQWPPTTTDSAPWDGFHTLEGNFVPEDSERQEMCTVKPFMTSYEVQTSFQPTSESHRLSSSTCGSVVAKSKSPSLIVAASSNSSVSQGKYPRILLPKLKNGPKSYDNSQTNLQDTLTEPTRATDIPQPIKWDHTPASELRGQNVNIYRKAGRRNGRLDPVRARKAKEVRRIHACMPCWLLKIPCTAGDICLRCRSLKATTLAPIICTRAHLEDYAELFFPGILVSHLRQSAVENLTSDLSKGFVINDVEADLTCGSGHLPITLTVAEFAQANPKVSYIHAITYGSEDEVAMFAQRYPPPMALRNYSMSSLVDKCRTYARCLARNQRDLSGMTPKKMNEISKKLLEAISRYHGSICPSRNTALLDKAIMLYNVHYFMGRTVKFTDKTADKVASTLRQPIPRPYENSLISKLLNRQIKSAMHCLLRDLTREVLEELEKDLKTRSKAVWATSFCVISIICICIEDVQIAINGLIMDMKANSSESDIPSSKECIESCRKLDDIPFEHAVRLFHGIYKTQKAPSTHRNDHIYNPIRDGARIDFKEDLDQESADLVNDVRKILRDHYTDLAERARVPSFDFGLENLKQHMIFRENNSGRLLSTFLKSFKDFEKRK